MLSRLACAILALTLFLGAAMTEARWWPALPEHQASGGAMSWILGGGAAAALLGFFIGGAHADPAPKGFSPLAFGPHLAQAPATGWRLAFGRLHPGLVRMRWQAGQAGAITARLAGEPGLRVVEADADGCLAHVIDETDQRLFARLAALAPGGAGTRAGAGLG